VTRVRWGKPQRLGCCGLTRRASGIGPERPPRGLASLASELSRDQVVFDTHAPTSARSTGQPAQDRPPPRRPAPTCAPARGPSEPSTEADGVLLLPTMSATVSVADPSRSESIQLSPPALPAQPLTDCLRARPIAPHLPFPRSC
jgi:hypothetical protein